MEKNKIKSTENNQQITSQQEQSEHQTRGVYLRDDHCDWGSSGMNEFTEEFTQKNQFVFKLIFQLNFNRKNLVCQQKMYLMI